MESPVKIPSELASLLSCGLCRRPYDLKSHCLPKELVCKHIICRECVFKRLIRVSYECLCPVCGVRTALLGRKLPEATVIMFLLRELPALVLGRAMLDFSRGSSSNIEVEGEQQDSTSENWLEKICVNSFLANKEHCPIHAMPNSTWCHKCQFFLCSACADALAHHDHRLTRQLDYKELLRRLLSGELSKIKRAAAEVSDLAVRELNLLLQLSEACLQLQMHVKRETEQHTASMVSHQMNGLSVRAEHELNSCVALQSAEHFRNLLSRFVIQRRICETQLVEVHFQCRMQAVIQENGMHVLDFESLNERFLKLSSNPVPGGIPANVEPPPALILTNYCVFVQWKKLQNQLMPSELLSPYRIAREMLPEERHFTCEGTINSARSSAGNSSSFAALQSHQLYENINQGDFESQWQRQRQQEIILRLALEGLRQQQHVEQQQQHVEQQQQHVEQQQQHVEQQQQPQDDPYWLHGMRPILNQTYNSESSHLGNRPNEY